MENEIEIRETRDAYYYSMYAWALLNGACDQKTQTEFDNLALVPVPFSNVSRR